MQRLTRFRYNNVPTDTGGRYYYIKETGKPALEVREHMGSEILAYLDYRGNKIIAKVASDLDGFLKTSQKFHITFKPAKIHLFDKDSDLSLKEM